MHITAWNKYNCMVEHELCTAKWAQPIVVSADFKIPLVPILVSEWYDKIVGVF